MAAFDSTAPEVFQNTEADFLAAHKCVVLQVRRGPLSLATLDRIESVVRSLRVREGGGGFVGVLEETAELASGAVRARQMALFKDLLGHERSWGVTIVPRESAKGALLRAMMRVVALGNPRLAIVGQPATAGEWLGRHVKLPAAEIAAFIDWGRTRRPTVAPPSRR